MESSDREVVTSSTLKKSKGQRGITPRYYFHLMSPANPVRDRTGVELPGLSAAHWHAMRLVYRLRSRVAETREDWVLEVADKSGAVPLVVLRAPCRCCASQVGRPLLGGPLKLERGSR